MILLNDPFSDNREEKPIPGSYEWWYYDAISDDGDLSLVVIFYEGNPFSRKYIQSIQAGKGELAESFPAVSISVYKQAKPVYYSFVEHLPSELRISEEPLRVHIGGQEFYTSFEKGELRYHVKLDQTLDSGHALKANLTFSSFPKPVKGSVLEKPRELKTGDDGFIPHKWNLIQPRANVRGTIFIESNEVSFSGTGYHDHNIGFEPMKDSFREWYWGRFHFKKSTLIYYLMFRQDQSHEMKAWLHEVDSDGKEHIQSLELDKFNHKSSNFFGLASNKTITLRNNQLHIQIHQSNCVDSGPFYKRWLASATRKDTHGEESSLGITEYIRPDRIYDKKYWPLVNMRIRYRSEKPHWVHRSKFFYPWTW